MPNTKAKVRAQFNQSRQDLAALSPLQSPLVVYVETSSFCNLECRFCPHHISPESFNKENMSLDLFEKLIEDMKEFAPKPKLIRFCGLGDPLFNKEFLQMVRLARQSNVVEKLELITNGLLLSDLLIKELPKLLDRIIVSIEGLNNEDYENFTLRRVKFDALVDKLTKIGRQKNRRAVLHTKIHNSAVQNEERKKQFFNIFSDVADEIYIENLVNLWPEVESNLGYESGHRFDGGELNKVNVCPQIFKSVQINSDGRVIPCCIDWKGINIIGNLNKESIHEIWHGDKLRELRIKHLQGKRHEFSPCSGCEMNEYSEKDNLDNHADQILHRLSHERT